MTRNCGTFFNNTKAASKAAFFVSDPRQLAGVFIGASILSIRGEWVNAVSFVGTLVSILLSVGALAYSAGHLTSRVEALEQTDKAHDKDILAVDTEADLIRNQLSHISSQQAVILNELKWFRQMMDEERERR